MVETSQKLSPAFSERLKAKAETESYQTNTFRVAIYLRTNGANQKSGYYIQAEACRKYIAHRGWIGRDLFLEKGKKGTTMDTPIFQLMLKRAKSRCLDAIVVYSIDRLSRSRLDLDDLRKTLDGCNVSICSATESIESFSKLQASADEVSD
jgi:DNA invertase Pin-like site-specific DNA recombinase